MYGGRVARQADIDRLYSINPEIYIHVTHACVACTHIDAYIPCEFRGENSIPFFFLEKRSYAQQGYGLRHSCHKKEEESATLVLLQVARRYARMNIQFIYNAIQHMCYILRILALINANANGYHHRQQKKKTRNRRSTITNSELDAHHRTYTDGNVHIPRLTAAWISI